MDGRAWHGMAWRVWHGVAGVIWYVLAGCGVEWSRVVADINHGHEPGIMSIHMEPEFRTPLSLFQGVLIDLT